MDDAAVTHVLRIVESVPRGFVTTYGDLALSAGLRSPRHVGLIMARYGHETNWQRVVNAAGAPAPHLRDEQLALLRSEGVPVRNGHVVLRLARWQLRATSDANATFGVDDH